jgi:hypothetical protein
VKGCGVVMAMLPGQELGTSHVERSCGERGNSPEVAYPPGGQPGGGKARCRPMVSGVGGGPVVVRVRERRAHGEGGQQASSTEIGMLGGRW